MRDAMQREEALRSALGRLPLAVFLVDDQRLLRPLNTRASALLEKEGLRGDVVDSRPAHPLSSLVRRVLGSDAGELPARSPLTFPSGRRYVVEPSRRSEKGLERWLLLLVDEESAGGVDVDALFRGWALTERERETALLMARGLRSDDICETMQIGAATLKTHVSRILEKSGSRSRTEFLAKLIAPV